MDQEQRKRTSKFLSYVLRHHPEEIGISLDINGWVEVATLLEALAANGRSLSRSDLEEVVSTNDKKRFAFNDEETHIRANQGHSIEVELDHQLAEPPEVLLHGTPMQSVEQIRQEGLKKMQRHAVHLHQDEKTARDVGGRRGKPVLLKIKAREMATAGHRFWVTPNDVWLVEQVPPEYIEFEE